MTFPEFQRAGSDSCCSGKGGDAETREEQSRNDSAALGQVLVPLQGINSNIFEFFCRTKTPTKCKMLTT